ncbi:MAG: hypothetical protein JWM38_2036, partial [Sphingomonas bacterium]|nr:hypothetical protein [Sphingomonas bacterium]
MLTGRRVDWVRWGLLFLVALALVIAAGRISDTTAPPLAPPNRQPLGGAPLGYAAAFRLTEQNVGAATALASMRGDEWLILEKLALAYIARARLTGSFDDYVAAQS